MNVNRRTIESVPTGGTVDNVDVDDEDDLRSTDNWGGERSSECRRCDIVFGAYR